MNIFHTITTRLLLAVALLALATAGTLRAEWTELPDLPGTQTWGAPTEVVGNTLYVFGGAKGGTDAPNASAVIYALDLSNEAATWQNVGSMPAPRFLHTSALINGKVYLFGGLDASNTQSLSTFVFDPSDNSVTTGTDMPRGAYQTTTVEVGGRAFILGGLYNEAGQTNLTAEILVFDPSASSNPWSRWSAQGQALPFASFESYSVSVGDNIYFGGGRASNGGTYFAAFRGVVAQDGITWTRLADFPEQAGYRAGSGGLVNNKPLFMGGSIPGGLYFDNNARNTYNSLPTTYFYSGGTSDGTVSYLVGGIGSNKVYMADASFTPVASVPQTTFSTAFKTGQNGKVLIPVSNVGSAPLDVEFSSSGTTWATASAINIGPGSGGALTVNLNGSGLAPGRYSVKGTIETNDPNNTTTEVTIDVWVVDGLIQQPNVAVLEEAHGTWCPPCGEFGIPAVESLESTYGDRVIVLSHHDKGGNRYDPFATTQGEALNGMLDLNAYPTGAVQRIDWNGSSKQLSAGTQWINAVAAVLGSSDYSQAAVQVEEYTYTPATREVNAMVTVSTSSPLVWSSNSTLRLTAVVTESGYKYNQAFQSSPTTRLIEHKHVARHYWPSNMGQALTIPVDGLVDNNALVKPGVSITVPVSFTVPEATTPTASGDLSSVPITPENCHIVFLAHVNNSSGLGPILGATEQELTENSQTGGAISVDWGTMTSQSISTGSTASYEFSVTNNRNEPVSITINRAANNLPNGWTSEICTGPSDCDDANSITYTIPADGSHTFMLKINSAESEIDESGSVRLVIQGPDSFITEETYEASTSISSVAVPGEVAGLSMTSITPNPASSVTRINVALPVGAETSLEIFTVGGEKVATLFEGRLEAGMREIDADVSKLESGKYILVLTSGDKKVSRTMTIVR